MFKRDIDYIVKDDKVIIIDEFTGRMMDGRRWSEGLHQAVEAKEGVTDRAREPDAGLDHLPELFPHVSQAGRHDRHGGDRGRGILRHLQDGRRHHPDQRAGARASTRKTSSTSTADEKFDAIAKLIEECQRARPAGAGRHGVDREVRTAVGIAEEGRRQAQRAQRPLPRAGSAYRGPGRAAGRGHHRHQHGRPRHRHPARRQPRIPHRGRARGHADEGRSATQRIEAITAGNRRRQRRSWSMPAGCSCSAPSATKAAASTTSCAAARAVRAIPGVAVLPVASKTI